MQAHILTFCIRMELPLRLGNYTFFGCHFHTAFEDSAMLISTQNPFARCLFIKVDENREHVGLFLGLEHCPKKYLEGTGLPCVINFYFGTPTNPLAFTRSGEIFIKLKLISIL